MSVLIQTFRTININLSISRALLNHKMNENIKVLFSNPLDDIHLRIQRDSTIGRHYLDKIMNEIYEFMRKNKRNENIEISELEINKAK